MTLSKLLRRYVIHVIPLICFSHQFKQSELCKCCSLYIIQGVLLPADGVAGNMSGDRTEAVTGTVSSDECSKNGAKMSIESAVNKKKGVRYCLNFGLVWTYICIE